MILTQLFLTAHKFHKLIETGDVLCLLFIETESRHNTRLYMHQAIENSVELVLNSLSGENRSGHAVPLRTFQESCRVEEVSQGGEVACQVSHLQPKNEGKLTRRHTPFGEVHGGLKVRGYVHCVVFLGKKLNSYSVSLHQGV